MSRDPNITTNNTDSSNSRSGNSTLQKRKMDDLLHSKKNVETYINHESDSPKVKETLRNINVCAGCGSSIWDRTMLSAIEQHWHNHCLRCHCCGGQLAEMGTSLFHRGNMLLCRQDYFKLFGVTGICSACQTAIPPDEMVMRCNVNMVYHLRCFTCAHCHNPLLPGERYLLINGSPYCEHEFSSLIQTTHPPPTSLAQANTQALQLNHTRTAPSMQTPVIDAPSNAAVATSIFTTGELGSSVFCGNVESTSASASGRVTPRQRVC